MCDMTHSHVRHDLFTCATWLIYMCDMTYHDRHCRWWYWYWCIPFLDGYCSTVQGLLDWFEVDLGFTELLFIQIGLCVMCGFVLYSPVSLAAAIKAQRDTSTPVSPMAVQWVMLKSYVAHINELRSACEWVVRHMSYMCTSEWMSHVNKLCRTCKWVVFGMWMSRTAHVVHVHLRVNESC